MEKEKSTMKWYDSGKILTCLIIGVIALIILCSQSFAIGSGNSFAMFRSVINHNSIYLLVIVYFIALQTYFGKRNFNYLNLFLIIIYSLATITSFLTVLQSFSLNTIIVFSINLIIIIYLFHTMFRDTRVWRDYKLGNSPFNELSNELYFYIILVLSLFSLTVNLVSTVVISGVIISILDTLYLILFARYIYLYREYLDIHKKDSDNKGNFDEIKESIKNTVLETQEKVNKIIDEYEIDNKVDKIKDSVKNGLEDLSENIKDIVDKNSIDKSSNIKENDNNEKITEDKDKKVNNKNRNNNNKNKTGKKNNTISDTNKKKGDNK